MKRYELDYSSLAFPGLAIALGVGGIEPLDTVLALMDATPTARQRIAALKAQQAEGKKVGEELEALTLGGPAEVAAASYEILKCDPPTSVTLTKADGEKVELLGRGYGKSHASTLAVTAWILEQARAHPGRRILVVGTTRASVVRIFEEVCSTRAALTAKNSKSTLTLSFGSERGETEVRFSWTTKAELLMGFHGDAIASAVDVGVSPHVYEALRSAGPVVSLSFSEPANICGICKHLVLEESCQFCAGFEGGRAAGAEDSDCEGDSCGSCSWCQGYEFGLEQRAGLIADLRSAASHAKSLFTEAKARLGKKEAIISEQREACRRMEVAMDGMRKAAAQSVARIEHLQMRCETRQATLNLRNSQIAHVQEQHNAAEQDLAQLRRTYYHREATARRWATRAAVAILCTLTSGTLGYYLAPSYYAWAVAWVERQPAEAGALGVGLLVLATAALTLAVSRRKPKSRRETWTFSDPLPEIVPPGESAFICFTVDAGKGGAK